MSERRKRKVREENVSILMFDKAVELLDKARFWCGKRDVVWATVFVKEAQKVISAIPSFGEVTGDD